MLTDRENNLKKVVIETLNMNDATKEEIINVCNKILEELE